MSQILDIWLQNPGSNWVEPDVLINLNDKVEYSTNLRFCINAFRLHFRGYFESRHIAAPTGVQNTGARSKQSGILPMETKTKPATQ